MQQIAHMKGAEKFRPVPTQQSGTRTDPVRGSSVLEFPHKNLNRGHRGASTMGYGPQEAEEWTRLGLKTREEDEGMLE